VDMAADTVLEVKHSLLEETRVVTPESIQIEYNLDDIFRIEGLAALELSFKVNGEVLSSDDHWVKLLVLGNVLRVTGVPELGNFVIEITATARDRSVNTILLLTITEPEQATVDTVPFQVGLAVGASVGGACLVGICGILLKRHRKIAPPHPPRF